MYCARMQELWLQRTRVAPMSDSTNSNAANWSRILEKRNARRGVIVNLKHQGDPPTHLSYPLPLMCIDSMTDMMNQ